MSGLCERCKTEIRQRPDEYFSYLICRCENYVRRCYACAREIGPPKSNHTACECSHPAIDPLSLSNCCKASREQIHVGRRVYMVRCPGCGSWPSEVFCSVCHSSQRHSGMCLNFGCKSNDMADAVTKDTLCSLRDRIIDFIDPFPMESVPIQLALSIQHLTEALAYNPEAEDTSSEPEVKVLKPPEPGRFESGSRSGCLVWIAVVAFAYLAAAT
jgi:hypothetical protein